MDAQTWLVAGLMAWVGSLVFAALGLFVGYLMPSQNVMQILGPALAILAMLGGLFMPIEIMGDTFGHIAKFTPGVRDRPAGQEPHHRRIRCHVDRQRRCLAGTLCRRRCHGLPSRHQACLTSNLHRRQGGPMTTTRLGGPTDVSAMCSPETCSAAACLRGPGPRGWFIGAGFSILLWAWPTWNIVWSVDGPLAWKAAASAPWSCFFAAYAVFRAPASWRRGVRAGIVSLHPAALNGYDSSGGLEAFGPGRSSPAPSP